jgi:16S rRNA (guanine527-N7)-methyltransferase
MPLLDLVEASPVSLTSVRSGPDAIDVHLRDSLSGLSAAPLLEADEVVDIGSGAGFPGLPLALALPEKSFTLVDSVARKADFMRSAADALGLGNVTVIATRSEELAAGSGREAFQCVTARAVAPLSVLAELASPLLTEGGTLVAWKGDPSRPETRDDADREGRGRPLPRQPNQEPLPRYQDRPDPGRTAEATGHGEEAPDVCLDWPSR